MRNGQHVVADKSIWGFGLRQVNPNTAENKVKRERWIEVCMDCHDEEFSRKQLTAMDHERARAWQRLNRTERLLRTLRSEKAFYPAAGERPPYPTDWMDRMFPKERVGFFEGQASSFYNVSTIERDYFEMWYFANLGAYKAAAHGAPELVKEGHDQMEAAEQSILLQAGQLRDKARGVRPDPRSLWLGGEYTEHNREHN
jgi:hydroxylamine dehydrogenase